MPHRLVAYVLALALTPEPAFGHAGSADSAWPWVSLLLLLTLLLYLMGYYRSAARPAHWRLLLFLTGWCLLAFTLSGPLDTLAHQSLSAHMLQHMVLMTVAPPLLLLARPLPQLIRGLPRGLRRKTGPYLARFYQNSARWSLTAFLAHGAAIWLWHVPWAYQLALNNRLIHDLEHASFLFTGLWFWWTLLAPARQGHQGFGPACLWAMLTVMHTGMLGALLTFAPTPLYPLHPGELWELTQLEDQQLAGLIMWVPGGILYSLAALALCVLWLDQKDPVAGRQC